MFEKGFHHEDVAKIQRFDYDIFGPLRTSFIKTLVNKVHFTKTLFFALIIQTKL